MLALGGQIRAVDPTYRDVAEWMGRARDRLRRPPRRRPRERPAWLWPVMGGAALLVVIGITVAVVPRLVEALLPSTFFGSEPGGTSPVVSTISVDGQAGWQDSGISISQGTRVEVTYVSGLWTTNVAGDSFDANGQSGMYPRSTEGLCGQAPMPDAPDGVLVGRIGNGPAFQIGTHLAFTAERNGLLHFRINDADPCLGDNGGSIQVTVSRDR